MKALLTFLRFFECDLYPVIKVGSILDYFKAVFVDVASCFPWECGNF